MSKKQEFDNLSQQYCDGMIHWDEFAYPIGQMITELEQQIEPSDDNDLEKFERLLSDYEDACHSFGKYDDEDSMLKADSLSKQLTAFVKGIARRFKIGSKSEGTNRTELEEAQARITELEQRINDMPKFYYKHSFLFSEQVLLIQEMSSETSEAVRRFSISHGTTLKDTIRALRIAGMDSDSSEIFIHQDLTTTMSERGIHIVVDLKDIVRAVYKV